MDHVAIMRKSWGLIQKISTGEKKIESRWYKFRRAPWNQISSKDTIYFKDSGEQVTIKAKVLKVLQFSELTPPKVKKILKKYSQDDGISTKELPKYYRLFKNKKYCLLIYLKNPMKIKPFNIDKRGFGAMAAWISVENINSIKV